MTDAELLAKVKTGLGITTSFQDETLQIYIDGAKAFMKSAGVKQSVIDSPESVGCILQIVSDTWNYGGGTVRISPFAELRIVQLAMEKGDANV